MSSVTDIDERRRAQVEGDDTDDVEPTGVVESDLAHDTPVDEPEAAVEPKPTPPMQIPLPGTWEGIGTEFGGDPPDRSEIRLLGGKMPIEGSFAKGTEFEIVARVKITGVLGQDTVDAFGEVGGTTRRHMARLISVRRSEG